MKKVILALVLLSGLKASIAQITQLGTQERSPIEDIMSKVANFSRDDTYSSVIICRQEKGEEDSVTIMGLGFVEGDSLVMPGRFFWDQYAASRYFARFLNIHYRDTSNWYPVYDIHEMGNKDLVAGSVSSFYEFGKNPEGYMQPMFPFGEDFSTVAVLATEQIKPEETAFSIVGDTHVALSISQKIHLEIGGKSVDYYIGVNKDGAIDSWRVGEVFGNEKGRYMLVGFFYGNNNEPWTLATKL